MTSLSIPGYWCECTAQHHTAEPTFAASFVAYSPQQAVRWIRVSLRTIASALEDETAEQAWQWLLHDHAQAVTDLSHGRTCTLTLKQGTTALTWTARPVHFLTLAHRQGSALPACAELFPEPQQHRTATE
ncbi:MAG TPA: hypothetical protein DEQ61_02785 [Streptomyces sp.]|nr:hypothetical protein [Streptomyces sp.]